MQFNIHKEGWTYFILCSIISIIFLPFFPIIGILLIILTIYRMGLIKAAIILAIAIFVTNVINSKKEKFSNVPFVGKLMNKDNFYLYSIIIIMTLVLLLF